MKETDIENDDDEHRPVSKVKQVIRSLTIGRRSRKHPVTICDDVDKKVVYVDENKINFWSVEDLRKGATVTGDLPSDLKTPFNSVLNGLVGLVERLLNEDNQLITSHDANGRTLLHYASAIGHEKIVNLLLQKGADVNVKVHENKSALHWAVISGNLASVKALIRAGAIQCFSQEKYGVTPFLLSASRGHAEIMKFLLDNGADLRDREGTTKNSPLHLAAKAGSFECIEILLTLHPDIPLEIRNHNKETPLHLVSDQKSALYLLSKGVNPNVTDVQSSTPLHRHAKRENEGLSILEALLSHSKIDVNAQDHELNTPLHNATKKSVKSSRPACILLSHGANLLIKNKDKLTPFGQIKSNMPHIIPMIRESLDNFVIIKENELSDVDCTLSLDFSAIGMDSGCMKSQNSTFYGLTCDNEKNPTSTRGKITTETEFLNILAHGYKEILSHPLIEAFLELKWKRTRRIFYFSFFCHFILSAAFTVYVMEAFMKACPVELRSVVRDDNPKPSFKWTWFDVTIKLRAKTPDPRLPDESCEVKGLLVFYWCIVFIGTLISVMKEVIKFILGPKIYLTLFDSLGQWVLIGTMFMCLYWQNFVPCKCKELTDLQYPTAAGGLLISWSMILVRIARFPHIGLYVQMFGKVLKNFGGFIFVFASLLSAFALSMSVLYPGEPSFASFPLSMLKVLTMMTGDIGYEDLFYGARDDEQNFDGTKLQTLKHPVLSHFVHGTFVLIVTIVLMNLLNAIAITDIQDLEKVAVVNRLSRQTRWIFQLESFTFSKRIPTCLPSFIMVQLKRQILLQPLTETTQNCTCKSARFTVKPNEPTDEETFTLSQSVKVKVLEIAQKQQEKKLNPEFSDNLNIGTEGESVKSQHLDKLNQVDEKLNAIQSQIDRISAILLNQLPSAMLNDERQ